MCVLLCLMSPHVFPPNATYHLMFDFPHIVGLEGGAGIACWSNAGLMIKRLWVWVQQEWPDHFCSPELTFCADWCDVRSTPMLLQWHVKDPGHLAKSAGGRSHLNMHTPLTQQSLSGLNVGTYWGNEFTRSGSESARPQSSHLAELLWTGPGLHGKIGAREMIFT